MSAPTSKPMDRQAVHHIAKLASLSLSDQEADKLAEELRAIVKYVEQLNTLDTSGVDPTASVQLHPGQWREDAVAPGVAREDAFRAAPQVEHNGFAVPTFVEG